MPDVAVIIPAGGTGTRLGGPLPKQFLRLGNDPILVATVRKFQRLREVGEIVVVVPGKYALRTRRLLSRAGCTKVSEVLPGGAKRQDSVRIGLQALRTLPRIVLVHDAVRPMVTPRVIRSVIAASRKYGAAVVGVPVKDTTKLEGKRGFYTMTLPRNQLWSVQTPQGFQMPLFRHAHVEAVKDRYYGTDDAVLVERLGMPVRIVKGEEGNIKITTREDLLLLRSRWSKSGQ